MDTFLVVCFTLIFLLLIIIIFGIWFHTKKAAFKPKVVFQSDEQVIFEFYEFGTFNNPRTRRFEKEYFIGKKIDYKNKEYIIEEIRKLKYFRFGNKNDVKIIVYLKAC